MKYVMNENPLAPVGDMLLQAGALAIASYAATTVKRIVEPSPVERFARDARRIVEDFHRELVTERTRRLGISLAANNAGRRADAVVREAAISASSPSTQAELIDVERRMLANALAKRNGNQSAAARDVGVERKAFARRCKKLKVKS